MNTMVSFSSESTVKLIRSMASDDMVVQAAQVSSKGENNPETVSSRLISALMRGRHGSPFEHTAFTFFVEAPIFVFREWHRHRISSFNEMSGRYTELMPKFYIPNNYRKVVNAGTKMKPRFEDDNILTNFSQEHLRDMSVYSWEAYQSQLNNGIANEVARMVLPLNIYSQMYWTVNARSLMNFLSLRVESDDSTYRSYPQYEIDQAARKVEIIFAHEMPETHVAFVNNGRVAP